MSNNKRSSTSLVLALGPEVITVLQAASTGDRTAIVGRWETDTPPGSLQGGAIQDPARLTAALRALWRKAGLRERSVSVVLPASGYSMRNLRLPDLPAAERRAVVRGELEQNGALPFGGGAFDFIWLGAGRGEAAEVYAYFVADASVLPLREALDEAGLTLQRLEPSSLATLRAYLSTQTGLRPLAMLCPTERYTDLCIHDGREVRLLRRIPAGYDDIRTAAAGQREGAAASQNSYLGGQEEDYSPREPEVAIPSAVWGEQEGSISFNPAPAAAEAPAPPRPAPAAEALVAPRERSLLEEEVARSLAFYSREHQDQPFPTALAVVGHGEAVQFLERILADAVAIPVVGVDVHRELNIPPPTVSAHHLASSEMLTAAVGAAVGASGSVLGVPALHVGQGEGRAGLRARERRRLVYVGLTGAAIFLAVAAAGAAVLTVMEMEQQGRKLQLQAEIKQVEAERAPILRYHEVSMAARRARSATQIPVGSTLGRVAAAANDGIALQSLELGADGKLSLQGRASSTPRLERFGRDLAAGSTIRLPVIETINLTPEGVIDFRISALAGKPPPPPEKAADGAAAGSED